MTNSQRRKQVVLDFNKALWRLRVETPDTEEGIEKLLIAISISMTFILQLYESGVSEAVFLEKMNEVASDVFDVKAQA